MLYRKRTAYVVSLIAVISGLIGCSADPAVPELSIHAQIVAAPEWLASTQAPVLSSHEDVLSLWQSEKRCCIDEKVLELNNRKFYKACHMAVIAHVENDDIVVTCLNLMAHSIDRKRAKALRRFIVDHYSDYSGRIDHCVNCAPGDKVARVLRSLAYGAHRDGSGQQVVQEIETLFDKRGQQISPWVQVELYEALSRLYGKLGMNEAQRGRITAAYQQLNTLKQTDEPVARHFNRFEREYNKLIAQTDTDTDRSPDGQ